MNIAVCNVPLRSESLKTTYPPLGALAVIQSLKKAGHDVSFLDINVFRYSDEEIKEYFKRNRFDIVGISATVSTSYRYLKKLVSIIRSVSPDTVIIVGGAITASAEIILKFIDVDYCVIGEGEKVIINLARYLSAHGKDKSAESLKAIKGISFSNERGETIFTGYEEQISVDEIQDPDYGLLEKFSKIENYIIDPFYYEQFKYDSRTLEGHRRGKRLATVVTSRGCVNRCTFCHRWQKGIRIYPVERVISYVRFLKENYNVGFISFGDEDFGATKKWLSEFVEKIRPLDLLYRISGACSDNVNPDILKDMKESGCVSIHYGFESGSDKILKVMEKKADVELNIKVADWTRLAGLQTVCALVVGMPVESYETIKQTTDFVTRITESLPREPIVSINALVVLPGAPVYEYARYKGLLGKTIEDEEKYLLRISDQGGGSLKQLNLTDYPFLIVHGWIRCIYWAVHYNYYRKNKIRSRSISANPLFYRLRYLVAPIFVMQKAFSEDKRLFLKGIKELFFWPFRKRGLSEYVSLRTYLNEKLHLEDIRSDSIEVLRLGR